MIEELKNKILLVTFLKKNGETRKMLCTLRDDLIPQVAGDSKPKPGLITVYDLENEGWRCFYEDSIIDVEEARGEEPKE